MVEHIGLEPMTSCLQSRFNGASAPDFWLSTHIDDDRRPSKIQAVAVRVAVKFSLVRDGAFMVAPLLVRHLYDA